MRFGLEKDVYNKLQEVVKKYTYEFRIFGSRARGDNKPNSDIDLAVFGDVTEEDEMRIKNDLDMLDIPYMLDIVFMKRLKEKQQGYLKPGIRRRNAKKEAIRNSRKNNRHRGNQNNRGSHNNRGNRNDRD